MQVGLDVADDPLHEQRPVARLFKIETGRDARLGERPGDQRVGLERAGDVDGLTRDGAA